MALDRFVHFKDRKPTEKQVELVVRNYFGDCGTVEWSHDRWIISLPGTPTWTFEGIEKDSRASTRNDERWIEVHHGDDSVDVVTRHQDDLTNALAAGLANAFARYWNGEVDDGT